MVQAGPKIQLGGLKIGLCKEAYQVGMEDVVNIEPIAPASKQIRTANRILAGLPTLIQPINRIYINNNKYQNNLRL